ncbi:hypothetical protein ACFVH0_06185 [Streptomyces sp. NPDC127117]|uniref:hypothetical protein n=1 Tax=Streptomyces sp. NPDC127117 TaxID=3345368 RepID=UPI00363BB242
MPLSLRMRARSCHRASSGRLTDLHRHAAAITLTEKDVVLLAPAAATWFERGATPAALRHAFTDGLPQPLKRPAKLLRYRLTALVPPRRPRSSPPSCSRTATAATGPSAPPSRATAASAARKRPVIRTPRSLS